MTQLWEKCHGHLGRVKWKIPSKMWKMRRFRSSCVGAKYHPGFCSPFIHSVVSNHSVSGQRWLRSGPLVRLCPETGFRMALPIWSKLKLDTIYKDSPWKQIKHERRKIRSLGFTETHQYESTHIASCRAQMIRRQQRSRWACAFAQSIQGLRFVSLTELLGLRQIGE